MITSRNRHDDLRRTLENLRGMDPLPDEVLITLDGCTDTTVSMVERAYPNCRLWINHPGEGSVPSRDRMLREASGDVILSLDDDSYPVQKDFFARLPSLFKMHPDAAVISFPEVLDNGTYLNSTKTPSSPGHYLSAYPNSAAAMRRDVYLKTDGYPRFFVHAYEEPDYAVQCYAVGSTVWFAPELVIKHHLSPVNRNKLQTHHYNARNELWSVWLRCPLFWVLLVSMFRITRQFIYACKNGIFWVIREPIWWWASLKGIRKCITKRKPIQCSIYLGWMVLARQSITEIKKLEHEFKIKFYF
ncbi:GT2 family glycosyltransferase [Prosthecobacter fusiformis]|uniref:GT2 family glycosyltransferase n=1 Tax=Prosthecobacter fusiformis TaxID=48464 RepID=A0A4R7RMA7_9BACT|nr:glycosyltransferase [Prosthecobacter fusiformis]TDU64633.1 GT2 family glycosyltransferase [Prosthecobacter fusiformis]